MFGSQCSFDITSMQNEGTKILICIPRVEENVNAGEEGI